MVHMSLAKTDHVFCPLCGSEMKETHRIQHQGTLWVFMDCDRLDCAGQLTQKRVSESFFQKISFPFSTKDV